MTDLEALARKASEQVRFAGIALADVLDMVETDDETPHEQRSRLSDLLADAYVPGLPELGELQSNLINVADRLANRGSCTVGRVSDGAICTREYGHAGLCSFDKEVTA